MTKRVEIKDIKGNKDRYLPLSEHLIRGLKLYISTECPQDWLFKGQLVGRSGGDFESKWCAMGYQVVM